MWYEGEIGPDTLVWTEGMGRRTRVRDMPTLLGILRGDEDEPTGLDQLLADAADADHERVADGATTSFGDEALLDAELGSGSSSWELNGGRQRAAAAAAAAGRSSPALVLTLLRELQATQERCEKHEARESALAREEAEARELVRELRALAVEAREARRGLAASSPFAHLARLAGDAGTNASLASAHRAARAADDAMCGELAWGAGGEAPEEAPARGEASEEAPARGEASRRHPEAKAKEDSTSAAAAAAAGRRRSGEGRIASWLRRKKDAELPRPSGRPAESSSRPEWQT